MSKSDDIPAASAGALRTFAQTLETLEDGEFHTTLTDHLHDIVRELNSCLDAERKGAATLTIKLNFVADRGVIDTTSDCSVKFPPKPKGRTMFYVANGKFLSARNPRQHEMELRSVPTATPELRAVTP